MKNENKKIKSLAGGGELTAPPLGPDATQAVAPPAAGGQDEILGLLEQYASTQDAEIAIQIADMLVVEMGVAQGEDPSIQEQPASPPALEGVPQGDVPAFKKGGKVSALDQYFASKKK
jgi:hypothetical protein